MIGRNVNMAYVYIFVNRYWPKFPGYLKFARKKGIWPI